MTRHYEVVYIFDSALEEAAVNERLGRFHALLGGAQVTTNHWGKRQLANSIKRKDTGYYVVDQFEVETGLLPEFERAIKLDEGVMRFMTVQMEGEMPKPIPAETAAVVVAAEEEEE